MSVTLLAIEQELLRRVGPFDAFAVASGGLGPAVLVDELVSSIDDGDYADRWVLRRGLDAAGALVATVAAGDRVRRVDAFAPATGTLTVDRAYVGALVPGEVIELGVLHPTRQVRQAVRVGLSRCFFEDRVALDPLPPAKAGLTWAQLALLTWAQVGQLTWGDTAPDYSPTPERDLTRELFWLTRPTQLRGVSTSASGSTDLPDEIGWWAWFTAGGRLYAQTDPPPAYPATVYVSALRPHSSWVNHADSTTGPANDLDTLDVDLEYAVVAAHKYCWEAFKERLQIPARVGLAPTEDDVARGWRVQIRGHVRPPPDRLQLGRRYPVGGLV